MKLEKLTAQEEEVMLHIWKLGSCFVRDILNDMNEPRPPYTSLASVVKNLEKKKFVEAKKFGPITQYTPIVKARAYQRNCLAGVVKDYFTGSYKEMVSFFVHDQKLSKEDLQELIRQIEEKK